MAGFGAALPSKSQNEAQQSRFSVLPAAQPPGRLQTPNLVTTTDETRVDGEKETNPTLKLPRVVGGCRKQSRGRTL